jgi:NAD(P)-dependent dehydrogenase (short-subunit alcohol dehydrogenase family)
MERRKLAVVTGGSSGIGQATVLRLARQGVDVTLTHCNDESGARETLSLVKDNCPAARITSIPLDLSDSQGIEHLREKILNSDNEFLYLVNNAGTNSLEKSLSYSQDQLQRVLSVNLAGTFFVTQMALQHWVHNGLPGSVVTVTSIHQSVACPDDIVYGMSKAGLDLMTKTFALELGRHSIRLNNVAPGSVRTPWNNNWLDNENIVRNVERKIPLGALASADQVASVIVQLLSDDFSYVTGQTIVVDGGLSLRTD